MRKNRLISVCLLLSSLALNAQTEFIIVSGMGTRLYDINSNGNAVHSGGYYSYSAGASTPIESVASATNRLNDSGNIAGNMPFTASDGSNLTQAAYRKNGNWTAIGYFPGDTPGNSWFGDAKGISENSVYVTGQMTSSNVGSSYPFIYNTESGTLTKLTGDLLYTNARGAAVNNNGVAAGWIDREDIFGMGTFRVPAYFDAGGALHYIDFGTPEYGEANDVNNAGLVVGNKGSKAFIYNINTNTYQSFDAPAGYTDAVFVSVSENGTAVGYCGMIGDREVIIYHPSLGPAPVLLTDLLTSQGITLNTFDGKLGTGMGISSDGKYICGFDNTIPPIFAEGWVARLGESVLAANEVKTTSHNISIYPNPVKDLLNISSGKRIKSVSVYSADGRLVIANIPVNNTEAKIDLSGLKTGNYIAVATFEDGSIKSFKVLKK
ncbi:T9SS type A sorting domain-containing protein [Chryseobacterium shigense]|uniref:Secretion system C-terminal sorting domain-containing protein n=1 Tax=Chryseobacterium shigense TaxID=297244 RepID=A0A841N8D6_9FLAO|nr:T9SS type A sorting domain-containing protein [Chryseobacterium shigense]MBB6369690.1 hypothetical protein [Chryseobacterium shigense]